MTSVYRRNLSCGRQLAEGAACLAPENPRQHAPALLSPTVNDAVREVKDAGFRVAGYSCSAKAHRVACGASEAPKIGDARRLS